MKALHNAALFAERPGAPVLICASAQAADAAQSCLAEKKSKGIATFLSSDVEQDLTPLSGRRLVLFMLLEEPQLVQRLVSVKPANIKTVVGHSGIAIDDALIELLPKASKIWPPEAANDAATVVPPQRETSEDETQAPPSELDGERQQESREAPASEQPPPPAPAAVAPQAAPAPPPLSVPSPSKPATPKPRSFEEFVTEHYSGPDAVLREFFNDAVAAAASVGIDLNCMPDLDGSWHYLPGTKTAKPDQRQGYIGHLKRKYGVALPKIMFNSFRSGGQKLYWSPSDALWSYFVAWKNGALRAPAVARSGEYTRAAAEKMAAIAATRAYNEAQAQKGRHAAKVLAQKVLKESTTALDDPYTTLKGVDPRGILRTAADDYRAELWSSTTTEWQEVTAVKKGELLAPMFDATGEIVNIQRIRTEAQGGKRTLMGGQVSGCSLPIGSIETALIVDGQPVITIEEGVATTMSMHECTDHFSISAFNAGNLPAVARQTRAQYPNAIILFGVDNDQETESNPGLSKAREAAEAVGGVLAIPTLVAHPRKMCDFNDLHVAEGAEAVRACVNGALSRLAQGSKEPRTGEDGATVPTEPYKPATPVVLGSGDAAAHREPSEPSTVAGDGAADLLCALPTLDERPCFRVFDGWWSDGERRRPEGVWHFGCKPGKGDSPEPVATDPKFVCGPLHVLAQTHAPGEKEQYGRLLHFMTTKGVWQQWAMPQDLLAGDAKELRAVLLDRGLKINPMARGEFAQYLSNAAPKEFIDCTSHTGWAGPARAAYVLPSVVIGPAADKVVFQSAYPGEDVYTTTGTLEGWRDGVATMAIGNSMLTVAISAAASGPLLSMIDAESGGFHFVGDSSTGKSTQLHAACSFWGAPEKFKLSWNATSNGMEGAAAYRNDALLPLDEISECEPADVDAIVYMLSNGTGKQRASRTGAARVPVRFRVSVLSSGERTVETAMAAGGIKMKAGQAVRLVDLQVRGKFGAWNELHGRTGGTRFSDDLKAAANAHHGLAARAFLERLSRDDAAAIKVRFEDTKRQFEAHVHGGQAKRVAARFAAAALAGELLADYGITGWPAGWATEAAITELHGWQEAKGKTEGNAEQKQIVENVESFIQVYGESRFDSTTASNSYPRPALERAGWWTPGTGEPGKPGSVSAMYFFTPTGLREAIGAHDFGRGLKALDDIGALDKATGAPAGRGVKSRPKTINNKSERVYFVNYEKLTAFANAAQ